MQDDSIADLRFEEILAIDGISLTDPKAQYPFTQLFKEGAEFPEFFNDQQEGTNRIIKELVPDAHSNLRVIYLEVLRLALDDDDDTFLINLKRKVFSAGFDIDFTKETQPNIEIFNDFQFKRFFAEFVNMSFQYRNLGIEIILQNFPLIDQVFIHIFRSILTRNGIKEDFNTTLTTQTVFSILGKQFGLDIISYPGCWKFEDADMVCYEGPQKQLYLVYTVQQISKSTKLESEQVQQGVQHHVVPSSQNTQSNNSQSYQQGTTSQKIGSNSAHQIITQVPTNVTFDANNNITAPTQQSNTNPTTQSISYGNYNSYSTNKYGLNDYIYTQTNNYDTFTSSYNTSSYTTNYDTSYTPSYMPNVDTYKIDDKANDLVNKYLNMNPQDIIGTKYSSINTTIPSSIAIGATGSYGGSYESSSNHFSTPLIHYQQPAVDYNYTKDYSSPSPSSFTVETLASKYDQYNVTNLVGNINLESSSSINNGSNYEAYQSKYKSSEPYSTSTYSSTNDLVEKYTNPSYKSDSFDYKH